MNIRNMCNRLRFYGGLISLALILPQLSYAETTQFTDPATGLVSWKSVSKGFSLQLIQLHPDYVKAVYDSRGLPKELIDGILKYCVFGTIIKNETSEDVAYNVADWRYTTKDGKVHNVKPKSEWLKEWEAMGIGYRWSILADNLTFSPGDWIQGFTTVMVDPGEQFDFTYRWTLGGEKLESTLKGIRCASFKEEK